LVSIVAFGAAAEAAKFKPKSALTNSDYALVQAGLKEKSSAPRAVKRRVLAACKDSKLIDAAKVDSKTCTNRVMDNDLQFMLDVMVK